MTPRRWALLMKAARHQATFWDERAKVKGMWDGRRWDYHVQCSSACSICARERE